MNADPDPTPAKPAYHDLDDLPSPIVGPRFEAPSLMDRVSVLANNVLWLASGLVIAAITLGSPGCVGMGGPAVTGKVDVSVKETSLVAHRGHGGELAANVSFSVSWPSNGK